jgi:DNA-binding NtrC family response regulator
VRSLRVLLVEDDPDHVFLVRRALADLPGAAITVEVAGDGEQALERYLHYYNTERAHTGRWTRGRTPEAVLGKAKLWHKNR